MSRLRVALLGLGLAAPPHARSLTDLRDRVEVLHAWSRSPERCAAFAARFPFPTTTDLDVVLSDRRVDAAIVITPPSTHLDLGSRVLEGGKHLLIEKPMGLTTAQAERLVALADRRGRRIGVVLQHRFRPASLKLESLIAGGRLGPLRAGQCFVPWWRAQSYYDEPGRGALARDGGGVLMTQAIHTIDLLRALVGDVEVRSAIHATTPLHRMETEDYVAALLRLGADAPGALVATTAHFPGFPDRVELIFQNATARLEGGALDVFFHDGTRLREGDAATLGGGADPMAFPHDAHRAALADFFDAVAEGRPPKASGADTVRTRRLIDALLA